MRQEVGDGCLIPDHLSYVQQRRRYQAACTKVGINNPHGLRHNYAQWRYKTLTGWACPAAGGKKGNSYTRADKAADLWARDRISRELGHGSVNPQTGEWEPRIEITDAYLGPRS